MRKRLKLTIAGVSVNARGALIVGTEGKDFGKAVCPACRILRAKRKPLCDMVQYGFEWDDHTTVFTCKCGCQYFIQSRIWLEDKESEAV